LNTFAKSKRVAIRFDNRICTVLNLHRQSQTLQRLATPFVGFFVSRSKANRIETMVDKYTKRSILNAIKKAGTLGGRLNESERPKEVSSSN
jgi:hypothetical protein